MKFSDYIVSFVEKKVSSVFLLSGGGIMHLVDSIGKSKKLRAYCCHHEQAAATAAEGFGRMTNTPGVVVVTTGPGGTNAMTGIAGAWLDSIPMVVIAGQVKTDNMTPRKHGVPVVRAIGFQELNVIDMVRPITKYAVTIDDPTRVRYELEKAWFMATHHRPGPVFVEIPLDVSAASVDPKKLVGFTPPQESEFVTASIPIDSIVETLNHAKKPLLLVGNGVRLSGATPLLEKFLLKTKMPVVTTMYTSDDLVTYDYKKYLGRQGMPGNESANWAIDNCDVLLILGERLQLTQVSYDYTGFATQAKKIMVDIDEEELHKKTVHIDIPVQADIKEFMQVLLKQRLKQHHWSVKRKRILPETYKGRAGMVNAYSVTNELNKLLVTYPHHVTTSDGMASVIPHQSLEVPKGYRFLTNAGLGQMGSGLPLAIGACIASGKKPTVCMEGDGSLMLNIQELETMKHHTLPIKLFIWNNDGYYSIRNTHLIYFKKITAADPTSGVTIPDYQKIIPAWGLPYVRIHNDRELSKLRDVIIHKGPIVCELMIDSMQPMLPKWTAGLYRGKMAP